MGGEGKEEEEGDEVEGREEGEGWRNQIRNHGPPTHSLTTTLLTLLLPRILLHKRHIASSATKIAFKKRLRKIIARKQEEKADVRLQREIIRKM